MTTNLNTIVNISYKGELYLLLFEHELMTLTWSDGQINQDNIYDYDIVVVFNKAKQCSLYGYTQNSQVKSKLMDINYNDILLINVVNEENTMIYNLTTKERIEKYIRKDSLEFREE